MLQFNTIYSVWGNTPYSLLNIQILLQILSTTMQLKKKNIISKGYSLYLTFFYLQPVTFDDEEVEVLEGLVESVSFER